MIIIPIKWLFHWEYTQHFQTNPYVYIYIYCQGRVGYVQLLSNKPASSRRGDLVTRKNLRTLVQKGVERDSILPQSS